MDTISLPRGKYDIIYADPPWQYKTYSGDLVTPYPIMKDEDIYSMPVQEITNDNCILLMPLPPPMWVADEKGKLHLSDKTKKEMEQRKKTQEMLLKIYKK